MKIKEIKIGDYVVFTRPKAMENEPYYSYSSWYGTKNTHEYNDSSVEGEVIKINPKTIKIKQTLFPDAWDYNHEYIVPKNATVEHVLSLDEAKRILKKQKKRVRV